MSSPTFLQAGAQPSPKPPVELAHETVFSTRIPGAVARRLKLHCVTQQRLIQDVMTEIITEYLDRAGAPEARRPR